MSHWLHSLKAFGNDRATWAALVLYLLIVLPILIVVESFDTPVARSLAHELYVIGVIIATLILASWLSHRATLRTQNSEARYRELVNQIADGVFVCDQSGRYLEVNPAACTLLGYTREEILQRKITDVISPGDLATQPVHLDRLGVGQVVSTERQLQRKDGQFIVVAINVSRIAANRLLGTARDVTAQKAAASALQSSEAQLRALINAMSDVIVVLSADGRYLAIPAVNAAGLLAPPDQLLGKTLHDVLPQDIADAGLAVIRQALQTSQPTTLEYRLLLDNRPRWFQAAISPIAPEEVIWVARDITEAKQRDRERSATASLAATLRLAITQPEVLPLVLDQADQWLDIEASAIGLINAAGTEVILRAARGSWSSLNGESLSLSQGLAAQILRSNTAYANNAVTFDPQLARPELLLGLRALIAVPLSAENIPLGILAIGRTAPFTPDDVHLLTTLGDIAAGTLQRAAAHDQAQRRADQLATLNTIGRTLAELLDLPQIYAQLAAAITQIQPDLLALIISQFDPVKQLMTCVYCWEAGQPLDVGQFPPIPLEPPGYGVQSECIHQRQAILINDLPLRLKRAKAQVVIGQESLSAIYAPLLAQGVVIGVVQVHSAVYNHFTQEDAELLSFIASTAAIAIQNARLFEAERKQLRLAQTLQAVGALLTAEMSLNEIFDYLFDLLSHVVSYDSVSIQLIENDELFFAAGRGFANVHWANEIVRHSLASTFKERWGQPHQRIMVISDTEQDPRWQVFPGSAPIRSWMGAALRVKGRLLGILNVDSLTAKTYDDDAGETAAAFANQAAIALENAQLHDAIRRHADDLEERVIERTTELERERSRTTAILEAAGEGILLTDQRGTIEYMNPAIERLTGYRSADAIGLNPRLWQSGRTPASLYQKMWHTITHGAIWQGELVNRRQDGTFYNAALTIAPVYGSGGEISGYVGVQHDISPQKELEHLKDLFVSNVSHELRTPIANVKLYISLLKRGKPEKYEDYLQTLHREAARLEKLIDDLLDLSRLDLNTAPVTLGPTDIGALTAQLITDRTALAASHNLLIDYRTTGSLPFAQADPAMLGQVISNLLTNAINYCPAGGLITVTTALQPRDEQTWITITVLDTGPGISARDYPHLFERFYRGETGRKSGTPGTGLGLAISAQMMNKLGGLITVDSPPGESASFTLWLKPA